MSRSLLKLAWPLPLIVLAGMSPVVAHGVHARFAHNADKVDGLHARTIRGTYSAEGRAFSSETNTATSQISFGFTLPSAPMAHVVDTGDNLPACPGNAVNPKARPGHLCIYEKNTYGVTISEVYHCNVVTNSCANRGVARRVSRFGASVAVITTGSESGDFGSSGTWAVTPKFRT